MYSTERRRTTISVYSNILISNRNFTRKKNYFVKFMCKRHGIAIGDNYMFKLRFYCVCCIKCWKCALLLRFVVFLVFVHYTPHIGCAIAVALFKTNWLQKNVFQLKMYWIHNSTFLYKILSNEWPKKRKLYSVLLPPFLFEFYLFHTKFMECFFC